MRISILHIVVAALLAVVYTGEGIAAGAESACVYCIDASACCSLIDNDHCDSHSRHHQDNDHHSREHQSLCSCPCHMACIEPEIHAPAVIEYAVLVYPPTVSNSPILIPLLPDHIPLS